MNILVIGQTENLNECQAKFGSTHQYFLATDHDATRPLLSSVTVVFDFLISNQTSQIKIYEDIKNAFVFLNTSCITLAAIFYQYRIESRNYFFGFCGLPTFLNRPLLEVSLRLNEEREKLEQVCSELHTDFIVVDDRVGLVTPRVICMIINEAFYAVQESTASREDIDLAMKLGTNYPSGPFEWCKKIGIRNVFHLLLAIYEDTRDERYKISALLKKEAFR